MSTGPGGPNAPCHTTGSPKPVVATPLGDDRPVSNTSSGGPALAVGVATTAVVNKVALATPSATNYEPIAWLFLPSLLSVATATVVPAAATSARDKLMARLLSARHRPRRCAPAGASPLGGLSPRAASRTCPPLRAPT